MIYPRFRRRRVIWVALVPVALVVLALRGLLYMLTNDVDDGGCMFG